MRCWRCFQKPSKPYGLRRKLYGARSDDPIEELGDYDISKYLVGQCTRLY